MAPQTGIGIELLAKELERQIEVLGGNVPEVNLGVSMGGGGVSMVKDDCIYLKQSPHDHTAYEWAPAANCWVTLESPDSAVEICNGHIAFRKLCRQGDAVAIDKGIKTKFFVSSSSGHATLKVHATKPT